ncbi:MAG: class I SAM-dependent methyltransferase [Pirellulales bacterium]
MVLQKLLRRFGSKGWSGWPERAYQRERYQQRLESVQKHLAECLAIAPQGPVRIISICAGDGRDVIGVLRTHPRVADVKAWLVELNPESVALGMRQATSAGLESRITFLNQDATVYETYKNIAPADIVLACGVWGHVPPEGRVTLVRALAALCKPGGTVLWSRGVSKGMHRLDAVESLFLSPSWEKVALNLTPDNQWAVAIHRYCGPPRELPNSGQIFHFQRVAGT